jgi:hypothetical protein
MKRILLASAAVAAFCAPALAADMPTKAPIYQAEPFNPWFGYIEGQYLLHPQRNTSDNDAPGNAPFTGLGSGWAGTALVGYRVASPWDIAVGATVGDYSQGPRTAAGGAWQVNDGRLFYVDGELGYRMGGMDYAMRSFVGVRYVQWKVKAFDNLNGYSYTGDSSGVGPRVGFELMKRLSGPLSFIGGADASVLFGDRHDVTAGAFPFNNTRDKTVWQVGARVALDWEIAPRTHLAVGYKVNYWDGIQAKYGLTAPGGIPNAAGGGDVSLLEHGPFVRLGLNY